MNPEHGVPVRYEVLGQVPMPADDASIKKNIIAAVDFGDPVLEDWMRNHRCTKVAALVAVRIEVWRYVSEQKCTITEAYEQVVAQEVGR